MTRRLVRLAPIAHQAEHDRDDCAVDILRHLAASKELRTLGESSSLDEKIAAAMSLRSLLHSSQLLNVLERSDASRRLRACLSALRWHRRTAASPVVTDKVCHVTSLPDDGGVSLLSNNLVQQLTLYRTSIQDPPITQNESFDIADFEHYAKLIENWKLAKASHRKFDVRLHWDGSLKQAKPIVALCNNYVAVALNAKTTTTISLYASRNFELTNEIRLGWSNRRTASYLEFMAEANVLVLRSRSKFVVWRLDSFDVAIVNSPYNLPATVNERDFVCSKSLLACWDVEGQQRLSVYMVKTSHDPALVCPELHFDYLILAVEAGARFNCVLIGCVDPRVCYMELRSRDDFSLARTIDLSSSSLVDPMPFFYNVSEGFFIDEFLVRSTLCSYKVWCVDDGRLVHEFVGGNGHFDWFKSERVACGRLFAQTEKGSLYWWRVDGDLVDSWRMNNGKVTRSQPVKVHAQDKEQRDFAACSFDHFQLAVHQEKPSTNNKCEIRLSFKIKSFVESF